jgi:hypothetical protein
MYGTIDPGSCIRWVLGFDIKTGYDRDSAMTIDTWMGMADNIDLVREVRPALDINLAFYVGKRSTTKLTRGWSSTFFSFSLWIDNGIPRYWQGKCTNWQGKEASMALICSSEQH